MMTQINLWYKHNAAPIINFHLVKSNSTVYQRMINNFSLLNFPRNIFFFASNTIRWKLSSLFLFQKINTYLVVLKIKFLNSTYIFILFNWVCYGNESLKSATEKDVASSILTSTEFKKKRTILKSTENERLINLQKSETINENYHYCGDVFEMWNDFNYRALVQYTSTTSFIIRWNTSGFWITYEVETTVGKNANSILKFDIH